MTPTDNITSYCRHLLTTAFWQTVDDFGWNFATVAAVVLPFLWAAFRRDHSAEAWRVALTGLAGTLGIFLLVVLLRATFYVPYAEQKRLVLESRALETRRAELADALATERRVYFDLLSSEIVTLDRALWPTHGAFRYLFRVRNVGRGPATQVAFSLAVLNAALNQVLETKTASTANEMRGHPWLALGSRRRSGRSCTQSGDPQRAVPTCHVGGAPRGPAS